MPRVTSHKGVRLLEPRWRRDLGDYVVAATVRGERLFYALGDGRVGALTAATGGPLWERPVSAAGLTGLSVSSDGSRLLTAGPEKAARLLDAEGGEVMRLPGERGYVECIAIAPDGRMLATAHGRTVRLWAHDGRPHLETEPHPSTVVAMAFSADGQFLATCCYGGLWIIPVAGGQSRLLPWKGSLISAAWRPDGTVVACGSQDCSVHFWRLKTGKDAEMTGYPLKPRSLVWAKDGSWLATSGDAAICLWSFVGKGPEGTRPKILEGHEEPCTTLALSPDGAILASGAQDGVVIAWRPDHGRKPHALGALDGAITALTWADQPRLLVGADGNGAMAAWSVEG